MSFVGVYRVFFFANFFNIFQRHLQYFKAYFSSSCLNDAKNSNAFDLQQFAIIIVTIYCMIRLLLLLLAK